MIGNMTQPKVNGLINQLEKSMEMTRLRLIVKLQVQRVPKIPRKLLTEKEIGTMMKRQANGLTKLQVRKSKTVRKPESQ